MFISLFMPSSLSFDSIESVDNWISSILSTIDITDASQIIVYSIDDLERCYVYKSSYYQEGIYDHIYIDWRD